MNKNLYPEQVKSSILIFGVNKSVLWIPEDVKAVNINREQPSLIPDLKLTQEIDWTLSPKLHPTSFLTSVTTGSHLKLQ
jgi:hypothetical protein